MSPLPTFGLDLPYTEGSMDGATPGWRDLRAMAIDQLQIQLRPERLEAVEAFAPVLAALR